MAAIKNRTPSNRVLLIVLLTDSHCLNDRRSEHKRRSKDTRRERRPTSGNVNRYVVDYLNLLCFAQCQKYSTQVIHCAAHIFPSNYKLPIVNISIFQMPHPIRTLKIQLRSEFRNLASRRRQPLHKFIVPKKHAKLHKRSRRTSSVTFSFIMFMFKIWACCHISFPS